MDLEHVHNFIIILLRGRFLFCHPVVDFPIIAWLVDQLVILIQQSITQIIQMFTGKCAVDSKSQMKESAQIKRMILGRRVEWERENEGGGREGELTSHP